MVSNFYMPDPREKIKVTIKKQPIPAPLFTEVNSPWFIENTLDDGTVQPSRDWTIEDFHRFFNYFFDGYIVASLDDQTFIVNQEMFEHSGWYWKESWGSISY